MPASRPTRSRRAPTVVTTAVTATVLAAVPPARIQALALPPPRQRLPLQQELRHNHVDSTQSQAP
ncbi:exported protein of unknown function [Agreia sp. COWG]|nr:exported protein of unknown function [Agreia sp. COWG]